MNREDWMLVNRRTLDLCYVPTGEVVEATVDAEKGLHLWLEVPDDFRRRELPYRTGFGSLEKPGVGWVAIPYDSDLFTTTIILGVSYDADE